jgi:RNA-binding protein
MSQIQLTIAERKAHRAEAHHLDPVVMIGNEGLSAAVKKEINAALNAHGLIKIRVLGDDRAQREAMYQALADELGAAPIQHIGKLLVIWKPETAQPAVKTRRGTLPSAREAAADAKPGKGRAPRVVTVVKPSEIPMRKPKAKAVVVRGNERVTQGGNIKRAKKRQTSAKRSHQSSK